MVTRMQRLGNNSIRTRVLLVVALLAIVFIIYRPALSGALYYDDYSNLNGLSNVTSIDDAWNFIVEGKSGLTGRPIALATFLLHINDWPQNSASILFFNLLIHLTNTIILIVLGYRLLQAKFPTKEEETHFQIAFAAAALWSILPLLASTTLIAIQRMAGLSAMFMLLGLCIFVSTYSSEQSAARKFVLRTLSIAALGIVSFLSKENGGLIVIFALLIDNFLRDRNQKRNFYEKILTAGLWISTSAILFYLSPLNKDWLTPLDHRGYSPWERVQTELVLLWKYLYYAFLPQRPTFFGPFHDDVTLVKESSHILLAAFAWTISIAAACLLRRKVPLLLFAILWYLVAHLTESTSVMLELMFEHRNYVAIWAFCVLIVYGAYSVKSDLKRIFKLLLLCYWALLAGILFMMTNLWGEPSRAAESWAHAHPASARAALHAVFIELGVDRKAVADRNIDYIDRSKINVALKILDRTAGVCPECMDVQSQALLYSCQLEEAYKSRERFQRLLSIAATGTISISFIESMFDLRELIKNNSCPSLTASDLEHLLEAVLSHTSQTYFPLISRLYFVAAMASEDQNLPQNALEYLGRGEKIDPRALPILQYQIYILMKEGRKTEALDAIERRRPHISNYAKATMTKDQLDLLQKSIESGK